jgi:hypothetical protein
MLTARDDLPARLEEVDQHDLLQKALARVSLRVRPQTLNAFRLTTFDGLSGAQVAVRLGMPLLSVYKARSNVQKLLAAEVRYLEAGAT